MTRFTNLYPVWLVGGALLSLLYPSAFTWFTGQWIVWALTIVMLGMGFTLTIEDFKRLFRMPGCLTLGFLAHYTIMPLTGWGLAHLLGLEKGFAVGLILVAACPSGTASNVISYLAKADVALAVSVTLTSTLLAFIATPLWCQWLVGHRVPVDAWGLCLSTLQIVVAPVLIGVLSNWLFPRQVAKVSRFGPVVSVVALVLITCGIVSNNAAAVMANAGKLLLAAVLLHVIGFVLGYLVARVLRYPELVARTVSIEVGMQNGGLAAALAKKNFTMEPLAAVPAVFSSVVQNIVGSLAAAWWRKHPVTPEVKTVETSSKRSA
ncbi:BASS family bile acid:Na+ symporter [Roseimicrobium gellanilyticum]|uniref:BASS family bile acid:Na+ symporter n=1 Tax=Roseimicrobium gellanilyticum TaxID=748857 RepID=A0A366H259_9BACT|nr:bile acid:sodium symporter family protein [Roseimicrobium gellanilyticum]RBP35866.1 BASS family bile acid:Na+ symporter [Roseimicrobium gellanilyticum]